MSEVACTRSGPVLRVTLRRGGKRWLNRHLASGGPEALIAWCEDQIGIAAEGSKS